MAAARLEESRVLVMRGEPGVGKTALLDYLAGRAAGCWVLRVSGVQWEMELAFAGVHQLCAPLLGRLEVLPGPQREALATAFGISAGPVPDLFLVGLAVLGLHQVTATRSGRDRPAGDSIEGGVLGITARRSSSGRSDVTPITTHLPNERMRSLAPYGLMSSAKGPAVSGTSGYRVTT